MNLSSFPHLVKEWHPTKNGDLTPNDFTHGSHFKAWWLCSKAHSYESIIQSRAGKKPQGCPYCSGKRVSKENNLFIVLPLIAKEWDYDKNKPLRPENYSFGAHYNAWWLCSKGHNYQSTIVDRVRTMVKCPFCQGKKTLNFDLWK